MSQQPSGKIGKYEIKSVLGKGAMGVVYRALDPDIGREVAIKTMSGEFLNDKELRIRFLREAQSAGRLQHPNIVTVFELFEEEGTAYLVMELLEGASLYSLIKNKRPLDISEKLSVLQQIAGGLHHAHENGIVHRDIKPSNVFVSRDGVVKVLDFGVAKIGEGELTKAGTVFGTVEYMAPEQVRGQPVDARADIFSVGVVAYELLAGRNPFRGDTLATSVFKILSDDPGSPAAEADDIPEGIEHAVLRALAKKPDLRFQTLADMAVAIGLTAKKSNIELRPPQLSTQEVETAKTSGTAHSEGPQVSQWSNVAAAAGQLEGIFKKGIDCLSSGNYQDCVDRMSEVLDAVPVHSMALHYLSQSEEKLRQERLPPEQHREAAAALAEMRTAHREGEAKRVIEAANKLLAIDPESLEARWYRRNAETRLVPSRTRDGSVMSSRKQPSSFTTPPELNPTLIVPAAALGTHQGRSNGIWILGGVGILFLSLIALVWTFSGNLDFQNETEANSSKVRVSPFDDSENDVVIQVPQKKATAPSAPPPGRDANAVRRQRRSVPTLPPSINNVFPNELPTGEKVAVQIFGNNFAPRASLVTDGAPAEVEIISSRAVSPTLMEATLRLTGEATGKEFSLTAMNPNGEQSLSVSFRVISP
jgi:serine/threonine protein kinase